MVIRVETCETEIMHKYKVWNCFFFNENFCPIPKTTHLELINYFCFYTLYGIPSKLYQHTKSNLTKKETIFTQCCDKIIFRTTNKVHNTIPKHRTDTQRFIMHTYVFHAIKVESKCKGKFLSSRVDFNLNGSNWFVFASLFEFRFNPFLGPIFTCK